MAGKFPLDIVLRAIDNVSAPLRGIAGRIQAFGGVLSGVGRKFADLGQRSGISNLIGSMGNLKNAVSGVGEALGKSRDRLLALGATFGITGAAAGAFIKHFASSGAEIENWSNRLGVTAEYLQATTYAAKQFGIEQDALIDGMKELSLRADEYAVTGKGSGEEAFQRLGLSQKQISKTAGNTQALFELVLKQLRKVSDVAKRQRIVDEIFGGTGGEQMAELVSASAEEMARLRKEAQDLGVVMSNDNVSAARDFNRQMERMGSILTSVQNTVGAALMPVLSDMLEQFKVAFIEYRPQIEAFAQTFAKNLPDNIKRVRDFFLELRDGIQPVIDAFKWLTDTCGTANVVLAALALYIGGPLIVSLVSLTGALFSVGTALTGVFIKSLALAGGALKAFGTAILTTPLGWFLAAVAAIGAAVYIIYDNWENIAAWFTEKMDAVKAAFSDGIVNGLLKTWQEFNPVTVMMDAFNGLIKYLTGWDLAAILREKIAAAVSAITSSLPEWAKGLLGIDGSVSVTSQGGPGQPAAAVGQQAATGAGATPIGMRAAAIGQQAAQTALAQQQQAVLVTVDLKNAPQGTRTTTSGTPGAKFDTNIGYAMGAPN